MGPFIPPFQEENFSSGWQMSYLQVHCPLNHPKLQLLLCGSVWQFIYVRFAKIMAQKKFFLYFILQQDKLRVAHKSLCNYAETCFFSECTRDIFFYQLPFSCISLTLLSLSPPPLTPPHFSLCLPSSLSISLQIHLFISGGLLKCTSVYVLPVKMVLQQIPQ